ncbi:FMN-binding protein [Pseudobutyrivibrio sp.]|uniref:FMN-binding protein n=1 Tax=Pseudobutyrivibrio sp. TaxID=2014367 RepID=UPI00386BC5B5
MKNKITVKSIICLILFLGGLIYGLLNLKLIGHRPPVIFITLGLAVIGLAVLFFISIKNGNERYFKKIVMVAVILLAAYGITEMVCNEKYQEQVAAMQDWDVDLNSVADGVYTGESDVGYIKAVVEVEVKDHKLVRVDLLKHVNEHGGPAEIIVENMVEEQTVDVDAVSSATNSSKVIKTAVKNALLQGIK